MIVVGLDVVDKNTNQFNNDNENMVDNFKSFYYDRFLKITECWDQFFIQTRFDLKLWQFMIECKGCLDCNVSLFKFLVTSVVLKERELSVHYDVSKLYLTLYLTMIGASYIIFQQV